MEYYGKCKYDIKNDCSSPRNHKMMMTRAGKFMIHSVLYASLILLTIPWTQKMPLSKKKKEGPLSRDSGGEFLIFGQLQIRYY